MGRVLAATQSWGAPANRHGDVFPLEPFTSTATFYTASTGGTAITGGDLVTNAYGELPGYVETGSYSLTIGGRTLEIEAVSGTPGGGGVSDHGALSGLGDDDHAQYHTDARGDARYPLRSANLSDLGSAATARSNLGLGPGAVHAHEGGALPPAWFTGRHYSLHPGWVTTNSTLVAARLYLAPFFQATTEDFSALEIWLVTLAALSSVRPYIYAHDDVVGGPAAMVHEGGTIDCTTGSGTAKADGVAGSLAGGRWYWGGGLVLGGGPVCIGPATSNNSRLGQASVNQGIGAWVIGGLASAPANASAATPLAANGLSVWALAS